MMRAMLRLESALMLIIAMAGSACSKEQQPTSTAPTTTPVQTEAVLPSLALPAAVPAEAAGVLVVRSTESLYATYATLDILGPGDPTDVKAMRAEVDEFLRSRLGMTLTTADRATVFFTAKEGIAVVLQGVEGTPRGTPAGEVGGVGLLEVDGLTLAEHDGQVVLGQRPAVALALASATGQRTALRDSTRPLLDAVMRHSEGVKLAAAIDVAALPPELRREAEALGVEQAALSYGDQGIRVAAYGDPNTLARVRELVMSMLEQRAVEAERAHEQALRGGAEWSALSAIAAHYQWKQAHARLVPTLEGRRLSLHLPIQLDDPMVLASFAGMATAIAVPAFTKYMRRSKTAEARVGVAQMFDGVAEFFSEERLRTGEVKLKKGAPKTVHRCPSDGRLVGQAGPTPPLSLRCAEGPEGKCVPVRGTPSGPGEYSIDLWLEDPVWREIDFVQEQPHAFHYGFRWANGDTSNGFGNCMFTAQAFGDLDDDGLFSTYERAGAADEYGLNAAAGLYIDQEIE